MSTLTTVYLAPEGFEQPLAEELALSGVTVLWQRGRLFGASGEPAAPAWAQNIWYEPEFISIKSIADGASRLRALQRNWALASVEHHRRAELIRQKLPPVGVKPFVFGSPLPVAPMGGWTLWDESTILASPRCQSLFANGEPHFAEDTSGPPAGRTANSGSCSPFWTQGRSRANCVWTWAAPPAAGPGYWPDLAHGCSALISRPSPPPWQRCPW